MRTDFDFAPFYRATVGFDRVFDLLDSVAGQGNANGYPPYNIEKTGENAYKIVMAVAGFAESELNLSQPSVSYQVKELEEVLGVSLLDRLGKRVRLTEAGEILYGYTQRTLNLLDEATLVGCLVTLERLKLIDLLPGNKVRLLTARDPEWRKGGPMRRIIDEMIKRDFMNLNFAEPDAPAAYQSAELAPGAGVLGAAE